VNSLTLKLSVGASVGNSTTEVEIETPIYGVGVSELINSKKGYEHGEICLETCEYTLRIPYI